MIVDGEVTAILAEEKLKDVGTTLSHCHAKRANLRRGFAPKEGVCEAFVVNCTILKYRLQTVVFDDQATNSLAPIGDCSCQSRRSIPIRPLDVDVGQCEDNADGCLMPSRPGLRLLKHSCC